LVSFLPAWGIIAVFIGLLTSSFYHKSGPFNKLAGLTDFTTQMSKESKTSPRGRDARTGEFTTVKEARQHPNTHVVERVPKPGYGDTSDD